MSNILDKPIARVDFDKSVKDYWMVDFEVYSAFRAECLRLEKIKKRLEEDCRKLREYRELLK